MLWCLRPFSYLFNIYWSSAQPVIVGGYAHPPFELPPNFTFHSIHPDCYPAERWSNGVIEFFQSIKDPFFVWMLEDYWLNSPVNTNVVDLLVDYMHQHPDVLRIDLTTDRLCSGHARDIGTWNYIDLVETTHEVQYQLSTQAALVNRRLLLQTMKPDLSPWDYELQDTKDILPSSMRILGTHQHPVKYTIGIGTGLETGIRTDGIAAEHVEELTRRGWLDAR